MELVYSLALDGNVRAALDRLYEIDPGALTPEENEVRQKYIGRFGSGGSPEPRRGSTLLGEITGAFQDYWDRVLLQELSPLEGSRYLFGRLAPLAGKPGEIPENFEEEAKKVACALTEKLREAGIHALIGNVSPHMNFMAWRKENRKTFEADLGAGELQLVEVVLMEEFESLGWAAYATFGKFHVGGWVGEKSLHCVASSYDLESEKFKVSFLAHEARHFADLKSFPKLKSLDLEYRAKLTELALAANSHLALLEKFILEQKENPANPHSYASFLLLQRLSEKFGNALSRVNASSFSPERTRRFARELLEEHTLRLREQDPGRVETALP